MVNLETLLACAAVFLWNFNAIGATTTTRAPDYGEQWKYVKTSWIGGGSLPEKPENERASILSRRERGTPTTNQTQEPHFPEGYVRVDVQFPKKTENLNTELQEVLRKLERIESSVKTIEAELSNVRKNGDHFLGSGNTNQTRPENLSWADCWDVLKSGHNVSGVYKINPLSRDVNAFDVYCNMDTHGGGWTVFQTRKNGQTNFYQDWKHYKEGFGDTHDEYWLGLERVHQMTKNKHYELLIELKDFEDSTRYGIWNHFVLGSETEGYHIAELGTYGGDAGDSLTPQSLHSKFSTWDVDNDSHETHCARVYTAPWWHKQCFEGNLNGLYVRGAEYNVFANGIIWKSWREFYYSLKESRMSIRPRSVTGS